MTANETRYEQLIDLAQGQLSQLRAALDVRLAALEAAIADPSRSASLAGLILDLARVATEEAQAAAASACLDVKQAADRQVAQARSAAQAAIEAERAARAELRRAAEDTHTRISSLEANLSELSAIRADLEGAVAQKSLTTADLERELAALRGLLETERESSAQLHQAVRHAEGLSATLDSERAAVQAAHDALATELARERATASDVRRTLADAQAQLEAERASTVDLGDAVKRAEEQLATVAAGEMQAVANQEFLHREVAAARTETSAVRAELEAARTRLQELESERVTIVDRGQVTGSTEQKLADLVDLQNETIAKYAEARRDLTTARSEASAAKTELDTVRTRLQALESERASTGELRAALAQAEQRLADAIDAQDETSANYKKIEKELASARKEVSVLRAKLDTSEKRHENKKSGASSKSSPAVDDEWESVRLATRCAFREPIRIEVDGAGGLLVDLSTDGCQLLLASAVKRNQMLKVVLPSEGTSIACTGKVAWTRLDLSQAGGAFTHRAGVAFSKPDASALEAFVAARRE